MRSLRITGKLLLGILFLLSAVFSSPPSLLAVTIVEVYSDNPGEGFLDKTALTDAEKTALVALGNDADTVGEARRNAFGHATSILEERLGNTGTIRTSTGFVIFEGQEDPEDPDECGERAEGNFTIATAGPGSYSYFGSRFTEGDAANPGSGTAYPVALFEALSGQNVNGENADILIAFSKCLAFYYGITERAPQNQVDFVLVALHEIIHGLGFISQVNEDGSFSSKTINITERNLNDEIINQRQAVIRSRTIYDEQIYSETDDDLLVNLTSGERAAATTSDTGLLWEGTDGGRNSCSYGQSIAEGKYSSAKSRDGKPMLHAPSPYQAGASVSHVHANTQDIMEALAPVPENMDLALGMLKDMGWSVSADGFPASCNGDNGSGQSPAPGANDDGNSINEPVQPALPSVVTVSFGSSSYSVTEGDAVAVTVTLSAGSENAVTVPITTDQATTAADEDYSLQPAATVTFASGETSKDITLTATDDNVDGEGEVVVLAFGTLPPRVFRGVQASTTVTIEDNGSAQPSSASSSAGISIGCSLGAEADHRTASAAAHLLAAIVLVLPAFFRKNRPTG